MASYIREDATFLGTKNSAESDSSAESLFAPCSSKERDGRKGMAAPRSQLGRGRREWGTSGRRSLKLKKKKKKGNCFGFLSRYLFSIKIPEILLSPYLVCSISYWRNVSTLT